MVEVALAVALGEGALGWCRAGRDAGEQPCFWAHFWSHAVDGGWRGSIACGSFREGLAVLLPALLAYPQAHRPLADALAQVYFATLQRLGQEPDPDLMAAYAAAFADGEAPP